MEIIPKKIRKSPEWHKFGFYLAAALLIAVVLGYAVLFYFEGKTLNALQDVEEKINRVGAKEERITEAKVLISQRRIGDFAKLLQNHKKTSNFFAFLEQNCHPKVWLTGVTLEPDKAEALVSGQALNFQALGQQLSIFRAEDSVSQIELTDLSIGEDGGVEFSVYFYLNPQVFK